MLIYSDVEADSDTSATGSRRRWHSIGIVYFYSACEAARSCKGKRFLTGDVPQLPLKACDASQCKCRYRHYPDRRAEDRRRDANMAYARVKMGLSRRRPQGRRANDLEF